MQRLRENQSIDFHLIRYTHITWASISAREGDVKINPLFFGQKSVFIFYRLTGFDKILVRSSPYGYLPVS